MIKTLDFVHPKNDNTSFGIVVETSLTQNLHELSVKWIVNNKHHKTAWYSQKELIKIGNLPHLLTECLKHPFGSNYENIY